jgi:hypothetical protein
MASNLPESTEGYTIKNLFWEVMKMKSKVVLGISALIVQSLISFIFANAQNYPPGMVSYWRFDEGSGTTAADSVDVNDGTINGATWTTGQVDDALSFDGEDYIEILDSSNLNLSMAFTIIVWIYPDSLNYGNAFGHIVKKGDIWNTRLTNYRIGISRKGDKKVHLGMGNAGVYYAYYNSNSLMSENVWTQVAATYDKGSNTVRIYINGELDATHANVPTNPITGLWNLRIGDNYGMQGFKGMIDEVAIYNIALSPEEIQQHYEKSRVGLGYYVSSVDVEVDIKPGSEPNPINLKSKGVIPVAILTTDEFDAASIDGATVRFGPDSAKPVHGEGHLEDVNDDDMLDWVGHFKTQVTGIKSTDVEAVIIGQTEGGEDIIGKDSVNIVGGSKKAPPLNSKHKLTVTWAAIKSKK